MGCSNTRNLSFPQEKRRYGRGDFGTFHAYLAPVAHPWCSPDASRASISGIQWPKQPSHEVNYPFKHFHSPCYAKTMESLVFPSENSHFLVVTSSLCHPNSASLRSKIAHGTTPAANSPPSVANRSARQTVAGLAFQASSGQN